MKNQLIDPMRPIALVGAGQLGNMSLSLWPRELEKPVFFLDEVREGQLSGIPIHKTSLHTPDPRIQYVLSFFKVKPSIVKNLFTDFLNQEILTVYDLLTQFNSDKFSNGWIGNFEKLETAKNNLQYFHDRKSKLIYSGALNWRYLRILEEGTPSEESFKYDLSKYGREAFQYSYVFDIGSYDLSFPRMLTQSGISWHQLVVIEPDWNRHQIIRNQISILKDELYFPCTISLETRAIWSQSGNFPFYANGLLSARIAQQPDPTCVQVGTATLESIVENTVSQVEDRVLIKLHVEGAEWPILNSSLSVLRSLEKCDLLVNLSHDENSLVEIPRLLASLGKHDLYLDSHALFGEGLTLFAKSKG